MSINDTYVRTLTTITVNLPLVINFITVISGTIGGICNLITFTAPRLRQNACVFYLLCASIFQIISILFNVPPRMALDNFGNNLERQSIVFCKLRYYLSLIFPNLVSYYMVLAVLDRCLATSTNVGIRAWSQLKVAHRLSIVLLAIAFATNIQSIVLYDIYNNNCQVAPGSAYTVFFAVYLIVVISLLPYILMLIFSLIMFGNFRSARQRILPTVSTINNSRRKRMESQLILVEEFSCFEIFMFYYLDHCCTSDIKFDSCFITFRFIYLYNIN